MAGQLLGEDVYVVAHVPGRGVLIDIITAPLAVKSTANFDLYQCMCVCECMCVCMCMYVCM